MESPDPAVDELFQGAQARPDPFGSYTLFAGDKELLTNPIVSHGFEEYVGIAKKQQYYLVGDNLEVLYAGAMKRLHNVHKIVFEQDWSHTRGVLYSTSRCSFDASNWQRYYLAGSPLARSWHALYLSPVRSSDFNFFESAISCMSKSGINTEQINMICAPHMLRLQHFDKQSRTSTLDHVIQAFKYVQEVTLHDSLGAPGILDSLGDLQYLLSIMPKLRMLEISIGPNSPKYMKNFFEYPYPD